MLVFYSSGKNSNLKTCQCNEHCYMFIMKQNKPKNEEIRQN